MSNQTAQAIYIFYGFSGDGGPTPAFPGGQDNNRSLELVAATLKDTLAALYPSDVIYVLQAWTKNIMIEALAKAPEKIRQVHIACHGDSTRLSLAYYFDQGKRLRELAKKIDKMAGNSNAKAIKAMQEEDALVAGFFTHAVDPATLQQIKNNHMETAAWQIWGCYCGYASDSFRGIGDAVVDPYLLRFNMGQLKVPGIAVEIAKTLGVTCTAAQGGAGMNFWHGEQGKKVVENTRKTRAKKPFWLWNTKGSSWVTYDATGKALAKPLIFQVARDKAHLPTPNPPAWLTQAGIVAAGLAIGMARQFRAPLGKTMSSFFQDDSKTRDRGERPARSLAVELGASVPSPPDGVQLRASWGAAKVGTVGSVHTPKQITIHHTATPNADTLPVEERIRGIQNYHIKAKKWQDIGYHFLISPDGRIWQGRENMERTGAHVGGHNAGNIGIAFIGDYQKVAVPQAALAAAATLVRWLADKYGIAINRTNIKGHREWAATTCPGDYVMAKFDEMLNAARQAATAQGLGLSYGLAVGAEGFSGGAVRLDPYLSLVSSMYEEPGEEEESGAMWDTESAAYSEDDSQAEDGEDTSQAEDGEDTSQTELSDEELAAEMSDVLAALAQTVDDEEDDFQEKLKQAALGQYKKDEVAGPGPASRPVPGNDKPASRQLSHDIFDHLGHDLSHATTFDLGKHDISQRLDSFAQEVLAEEKPRLPLATERKLAQASALDEMDLISSLALIDDAGSKKNAGRAPEQGKDQEDKKNLESAEMIGAGPQSGPDPTLPERAHKDDETITEPADDETISQEAT
ncbi:MAG: peptidoglycan recognition protein family protein [Proteobacteria bacterium]|nr:peptidoglycan recognition protein family protein [Pseudomonadota bacterium]MBU1545205.1 peptidoglycan recognition protein family protein [Pseudomonadota bacterium]MBU2619285.1 peptidoglycan recognition protein family protein [Pseudomonadota bacterium]